MVNFGGKAKIKKTGNLNSGRSYVITTVTKELVYNNIFQKYFYSLPILQIKKAKETIIKSWTCRTCLSDVGGCGEIRRLMPTDAKLDSNYRS